MFAYAIAHLHSVDVGDGIVEYLKGIDATLVPFRGRFLVHGGTLDVLEDEWPGAVVVIEFPSRELAHAWYTSPAYQEILPLRLHNADGAAIIVEGVKPGYRAADLIPALVES